MQRILFALPSPVAVVGAEEARLAERLRAALPEGETLTQPGAAELIDPLLTMKQNAAYFRLNLPPEKAERLEELIKLSGLRKREIWEHRFRKDMVGEKALWRLIFTLLATSGPLFLPRALEGLTAAQRERLDAILADEAALGRPIVFTAAALKDLAPLQAVKTVFVADGEELREQS